MTWIEWYFAWGVLLSSERRGILTGMADLYVCMNPKRAVVAINGEAEAVLGSLGRL